MQYPEFAALSEDERAAFVKRVRKRLRRDPRLLATTMALVGAPVMLVGIVIFLARQIPWSSLQPWLGDPPFFLLPLTCLAVWIASSLTVLYLNIWLHDRLTHAAVQRELAQLRVERHTTPGST